jgi:hypothetical protein
MWLFGSGDASTGARLYVIGWLVGATVICGGVAALMTNAVRR